MSNVKNWVAETTTTTGTGVVTLGGAVQLGDATFAQAFGSGSTVVFYSIEDANGNAEAGIGTVHGSTGTLDRDTVVSTFVGGTYTEGTPGAITLSGDAIVRCTFNATAFHQMVKLDVAGQFDALGVKAAPVAADTVLLEDSEDGGSKKSLQISNFPVDLSGAVFPNSAIFDEVVILNPGPVSVIVWGSGNMQSLVPDQATEITHVTPAAGSGAGLKLIIDLSGGLQALSWANTTWLGTPPTFDEARVYVIGFVWDGTTMYGVAS